MDVGIVPRRRVVSSVSIILRRAALSGEVIVAAKPIGSFRLGPILHLQTWDRCKVAVAAHHDAVAERESDRGDLDIDLVHRSPDPSQLGEDPPELVGLRFLIRPADETPQTPVGDVSRLRSGVTPFQARDDLAEDGHTDPDLLAGASSRFDPGPDATAIEQKVLSRTGVEELTACHEMPSSNCRRTASILNRRIFSTYMRHSASLSGFQERAGSIGVPRSTPRPPRGRRPAHPRS
jgi:hypothetical protein